MKYLVVLSASVAAIFLVFSCSVGSAYNCFSNSECPAGQACVDNVCVDGTQVAKDTGVSREDAGGAAKDGGTVKDGGQNGCEEPCKTNNDCAACGKDGATCKGGVCEMPSCGDACVPGCQKCVSGVCVPMDGVECCTDRDCVDGKGTVRSICDPIAHTCELSITCEGPCNSTADCAFRCNDSLHACTGGTCQTAQCQNDAPCRSSCAPDEGTCLGGVCQCTHQPACGDLCRSDDECGKWCADPSMSCVNYRCVQKPVCDQAACAKQCAPWASMCDNGRCVCEAGQCVTDSDCSKICYPGSGYCSGGSCVCGGTCDCTGRECGDDGCGGSCGSCPIGMSCNGYKCGGCAGTCGSSSYCGSDDGCGGSCPGYCNDASQKCEPTPGGTWMCTGGCTPACGNSLCGGPDGCGGFCWGQCPTSGDQCVQDASGTWGCVGSTCDPNGQPAHSACADQKLCACGNDCVRFGGAMDQPQLSGECLAHCANGGSCADGTNICLCTQANGAGGCATSSCFPQGTLKGSFNSKVLNSCSDQPAQTDIGQGNVTLTMPAKTASVNLFYSCHYTDSSTSSDYVMAYGLKACGTMMCPDLIYFGVRTADARVGTINYQSGALFAEWFQYTFSGQTVSDAWVRGYGISGALTLTQAGTTGKAAFAGSVDFTMIGYNSEMCGGSTGIACQ